MALKNLSSKNIKKIKKEYGKDWVRAYNLQLAKHNNLVEHPLYPTLLSHEEDDTYYVLGIRNEYLHYIWIGYTLSPFTYWINLLKEKKYSIDSIHYIEIIDRGLDKKTALKKGKALNKTKKHLNRKVKISKLLEEI